MGLFSKKAPSGSKAYSKLPPHERAITFFAEDGASWPHFAPIVDALTTTHGLTISYLTSSPNDPVLNSANPRIRVFDIGEGMARTFLFQTLEVGVFVATLPRLGISVFPRSKLAVANGTKYVNIFHSMASTHMIYDADGFDQYDTLFCVGPYMVKEVRAREQAHGLKPKELIEHGYGRLDAILQRAAQQPSRTTHDGVHVLIAPSWGPTCIFESCGVALVRELLDAECTVTARPHPETVKRTPNSIEALRTAFAHHPRFTLETDVASQDSLHASDIMISDWSGAAMEYAFGLERPVIFIDVERKINNVHYGELGIDPFEATVRDHIGAIVAPTDLHTLPARITDLVADPLSFAQQIKVARDTNIFNIGRSGAVAAHHIAAAAAPFLAKVTQ